MKKLILILIAAFALVGCEDACTKTEKEITARMGIVKRGSEVVFQTPCGYVEIDNPIAATVGGGIFEGAAVSTQPYITIMYANKEYNYACWSTNGKKSYEQIIRNFHISDSLTYEIVGCKVVSKYMCHM